MISKRTIQNIFQQIDDNKLESKQREKTNSFVFIFYQSESNKSDNH